jgi:hypothetical protein
MIEPWHDDKKRQRALIAEADTLRKRRYCASLIVS